MSTAKQSTGKHLLIDTDAGIDDAQAILMALSHPHLAEVQAITAVHGNTSVDHTSLNVLRLLKVAGRLDIPVYKGCSKALVGGEAKATHYHGLDGFGDVPDPDAPGPELLQVKHAVNALVEMAHAEPGKYTLVCLAPLTNIAMALRMDPSFGKNLKECFIMGGNYEGKGNVTPSAEFNFYADPEAANVVLNELSCPITMACWELCLKHAFSWEWYSEFSQTNGPKGDFIRRIERNTIDCYYKSRDKRGEALYCMADQLCMASALCDDIILSSAYCVVSVELFGNLTRGQMIVDTNSKADLEKKACILKALDQNRLSAMVFTGLTFSNC